ncbi:hypothetical protein BATDEDRAFT_84615 [Batrachochytrium dendrobatidis JAM81]|uniref:Uncharacterized protein n=2 Tax=Batrachochytrium dendrobatidis TaxID=109871 RepID=F4NT62_BATDJ|nr:uncharacterized protein BATDEDRAFT_84615 [Batrachochytrium dendrobatidis JAM81]EGF83887.1 hypothetical protein BATDEDRAFT_84615 [Batrachochytrium dendrobatidis JAM81]KAJ8331413.1 pre-mRNA-splicing factor prp46 [Batrachochytrium dendrobatidis]KAK5671858.1 pre-mRNA-splicing factor prp46 [Batrachochytrium dendrobatidis]OAJ36141.1 pre-mRNA-splicing factor prp5 [Batrachochytrium dendrobatidis JEL423]|eukprot:XP_006676264.1 hypothetical protein BATDEDRAFT_84615 [Batrachochytrium dendrobatidis JAM81]
MARTPKKAAGAAKHSPSKPSVAIHPADNVENNPVCTDIVDPESSQSAAFALGLISANLKRTHALFNDPLVVQVPIDPPSQRTKLASKILDEWCHVAELPAAIASQNQSKPKLKSGQSALVDNQDTAVGDMIDSITTRPNNVSSSNVPSGVVALRSQLPSFTQSSNTGTTALIRIQQGRKIPTPTWHAPWKLMRVISGHTGWVRCITVDSSNEWFVTGAGDRMIKIWDLASGTLKLSLTGHISAVRGVAVSPRHPYLFSAGEDKQIKCWDLEYNKVIRHYHGHLSGIYTLSLHPTLDVLVTGGRDSSARVWDMRTKAQIFALTGHTSTVSAVECQEADPQIITASTDSTIRLWDLVAGKTMSTLTHHKKSVRALALNPTEFTFASGSTDYIKQWRCPQGNFIQNLEGHNAIINTLSCNQDNVLFSGANNGSMYFWDWKSGYNFQTAQSPVQPGSLDSEAGVFCSTFDRSGSRLITGEADKTIKVWKEDEQATPETHPIRDWKPRLNMGR